MKTLIIPLMAILLGACATMQPRSPAVSILVDLDPASVDRTVIVESITADKEGRLYLPDRVSGNILRVDPKSPKPVVVGRIDAREIKGKKVNADGGVSLSTSKAIFSLPALRLPKWCASGQPILTLRSRERRKPLPPARKALMASSSTDKVIFLFQAAPAESSIESGPWRCRRNGVQDRTHTHEPPDGKTQQAIVANGLEFDA